MSPSKKCSPRPSRVARSKMIAHLRPRLVQRLHHGLSELGPGGHLRPVPREGLRARAPSRWRRAAAGQPGKHWDWRTGPHAHRSPAPPGPPCPAGVAVPHEEVGPESDQALDRVGLLGQDGAIHVVGGYLPISTRRSQGRSAERERAGGLLLGQQPVPRGNWWRC